MTVAGFADKPKYLPSDRPGTLQNTDALEVCSLRQIHNRLVFQVPGTVQAYILVLPTYEFPNVSKGDEIDVQIENIDFLEGEKLM